MPAVLAVSDGGDSPLENVWQETKDKAGESGAAQLLKENQGIAQDIQEAWDTQWQNFITPTNPLYSALADVGVVLAVGALVFWLLQVARELLRDEYTSPLSRFV